METTPEECIEALRDAAEQLDESPTKAAYEELGMTPASGTIIRVMSSWNAAKQAAGLEPYRQGGSGGSRVQPKPDDVELADDEEWDELTGHQRWYRKNLEYSRERKERRRRELTRWLYEYKRDECKCERCGETHPGCLEFHHHDTEEKQFGVSEMANRGHSIDNILDEIEDCVVLCANCHRKEHWTEPDPPASSQN
ncbi:MAG: homing endonuclease associated repeat-containing protein [Halobacteriales archaeon]